MEKWGSRLGFILAAIGSAVGIGNIWRFSAVLGQNGGGAYLIPYYIAVFSLGVPLMILELTVGQCLRGDVVTVFRNLDTRYEAFGWLIWTVVFFVLSYYLVIVGWTLGYFLFSLFGVTIYFSDFTSSMLPIVFFFITTLITGIVVSQGINKGIERITSVMIPLAFFILISMALFASMLPGFREGLDFLFTPNFSVLSDPLIWSAAAGQAFFSLSVGFGTLITYGNYLEEGTNIPRSSFLIAVADLSAAMLAGTVIFPIVFTFGLQPTMGTELAFSTLPRAFEIMPVGRLLAIAFFLLIFLAGFTSALSMMEVNIAVFDKALNIPRKKAVFILTIICLLFGLPSALSYSSVNLYLIGLRFLDLMDETVGTLGLPVTALIISIAFTWLPNHNLIWKTCGQDRLGKVVSSAVKYLVPVVLFSITLSRLLFNLDFPGWHLITNIPFIGSLIQVTITVVMLVIILEITLIGVRLVRRLSKKRETG